MAVQISGATCPADDPAQPAPALGSMGGEA
jgi:hypothetical protein